MDKREEPRGRFWIFDPLRCDGPVMLSALTLIRAEGEAALTKVEEMLSAVAGDPMAADEWKAIQTAMLAMNPD
jgi:hypothetical protein